MNISNPKFGLSDLGFLILQKAEETPFMENLVISLESACDIAKVCNVSFNQVVEHGLKLDILVVV